jgi:hypothetical protein
VGASAAPVPITGKWGRVTGQAMMDETTPLAGATVSAFDLGSNEPLTIRTIADLQSGTANPGAPVTDAKGNFDFVVQDPDPAKALRFVFTRGEERMVKVTERWKVDLTRFCGHPSRIQWE